MTEIPQEWAEKGAQALHRACQTLRTANVLPHEARHERDARAVLAAVLPDVRRAAVEETLRHLAQGSYTALSGLCVGLTDEQKVAVGRWLHARADAAREAGERDG